MTTSTIDRARLEELLGKYWEIAFEESLGVTYTGNNANRVLHKIRALFDAQQDEIARLKAESEERLQNCAALVAENERLRWAIKDALAHLQHGNLADVESTLSDPAMEGIP